MSAQSASRAAAGLAAALLLAGCAATGPEYARPAIELPARWSTPIPAASSSAEGAANLAQWWLQLKDPALGALIERALAQNRDIHEAIARLKEARALQGVADAAARPQLGASASAARDRISENNRFPLRGIPNAVDLYQAGFDASWELDLFGGVRRSREAAAAETERVQFDREAIAVSASAEVAAAYLRLRGAQSRLAALEAQIGLARETISLVAARVRSGLVSELDLLRAQETLAGLEARRPPLQAAAETEMRRLGVLVGGQADTLLAELAAFRPLPQAVPALPEVAPAALLARRADLRAIERSLAAENSRIGIAQADTYPRLSLGLSLGLLALSTGNFASAASSVWNVGPKLSAPIYRGGALEAKIAAAQARYEQAAIRYEHAAARAVEEVETAAVRYGRESERRGKLVEVTRADESALALAVARYRAGLADFLAVLDAQRQLFTAQDEEIVSREQALTQLVALYKALGGGWEPPPQAGAALSRAGR